MRKSLLICCTFFAIAASAQNTTVQNLTMLDLGPQGLGLTAQQRLSRQAVLEIAASAGGGYDIKHNNVSFVAIKPAYTLALAPKVFYNLSKRAAKGKTTRLNSGDYMALKVKWSAPFESRNDVRQSVLANLHWGLQRALGKTWLFATQAGLGYAMDVNSEAGSVYPALEFKFAYVFGGKKK